MSTKKVVLIDDDNSINFLHKLILEKSGKFEVVEVFLGADLALEYFETVDRPEIDIILLDINMPRMDGWEFIEKYKALPENSKVGLTILMLTTSVNPSHLSRAQSEEEIHGLINKPLKIEALMELLGEG